MPVIAGDGTLAPAVRSGVAPGRRAARTAAIVGRSGGCAAGPASCHPAFTPARTGGT